MLRHNLKSSGERSSWFSSTGSTGFSSLILWHETARLCHLTQLFREMCSFISKSAQRGTTIQRHLLFACSNFGKWDSTWDFFDGTCQHGIFFKMPCGKKSHVVWQMMRDISIPPPSIRVNHPHHE
jgi:hypothetical protein